MDSKAVAPSWTSRIQVILILMTLNCVVSPMEGGTTHNNILIY